MAGLLRFGSAISELLAEYDVDTVFGIPGVHTVELFRGMGEAGMRLVVPRHEQGAGFMADGYARVTGRPGVCYLVSGPGVLNAMTPLAQAWHDSIPLLVVASTPAIADRRPGQLHALPGQAEIAKPLCAISEEVTDPDRFAELVADAFASWASARPRPVHLAVPVDVLAAEVGPMRPLARPYARAVRPGQGEVAAAARILAGSARPVVIVGGGARAAALEVRRVAELLGAPVVTTGNARGLLPEGHPLALGTTLPFEPTQALIAEADAALAVGTEFSETDVIYTGRALTIPGQVIRVDVDESQLDATHSAAVEILADAATACARLADRLVEMGHAAVPGGEERAHAARTAITATCAGVRYGDWLAALSWSLPDDAIIAVDSTQIAYEAQHFLPWSTPNSWLAPYGLGTLGPALPMAIGAGVGAPDRPVVAVAGDGGVLFTLPELATAVSEGRQLTLIIWDNGGYGEIRRAFDSADITPIGTATTAYDLRAIAAGFGARAVRVDSPSALAAELQSSTATPGATVIVVDAPDSQRGRPYERSQVR